MIECFTNSAPASWRLARNLVMPNTLDMHTVILCDSDIFLIGGLSQSYESRCYRLDLLNPELQWNSIAPLPTARSSAVSGVVDLNGAKTVVIAGGKRVGDKSTNVVEAYNISESKWSCHAPLQTKRSGASGCVWHNILLVFGGEEVGDDSTPLATCERVDLSADPDHQCTFLAPLKQPRCFASCVLLPDQTTVMLSGGQDKNCSYSSVFLYDAPQNTWYDGIPLPQSRAFHDSVVYDNAVYVIGGSVGRTRLSSCFRFALSASPAPSSWSEIASLAQGRSNLRVVAVVPPVCA